MSLYYEYKSCCGSKKDDHKHDDHKQDCFCGKFPKYLLGQEVVIGSVAATLPGTFRIACIDEKSGIITLVSTDTDLDAEFPAGALVYVCCKDIAFISPVVATAATPVAGA
ncbi:hypothetical protein [Sutcliffiella deserti]|uniref:hypothetical protein n=1 Tax=Sutcliffiella deserti TaxID=2875501 RepID=UPI001CC01126|nr:hypothetical protein [Sutcliffiella deserti]